MAEKKSTIYDIANALDISVGTVYRALHDTGRISAVTKQRVLDKAKELNFTLNTFAQGISRTKMTIGVILCCPVESFLDEIHSGIEYEFQSLSDLNIYSDIRTLPMLNADDCSQTISSYIDEFIEKKYAGMILFLSGSYTGCSEALSRAENNEIPLVCLVNDIPYNNRISFITADGACAGRIASELLSFNCKGKKIAILTGNSSIHIHKQNLLGFMETANQFFEQIDIYEHQDSPERVSQKLKEIFSHTPEYQGLYITTASSIVACPLLSTLNHDKQMTIITTDYFAPMAKALDSGIIQATIFQNPFLQGRKAVRSISQYMNNRKKAGLITIPPQIVLSSNRHSFHVGQTNEDDE